MAFSCSASSCGWQKVFSGMYVLSIQCTTIVTFVGGPKWWGITKVKTKWPSLVGIKGITWSVSQFTSCRSTFRTLSDWPWTTTDWAWPVVDSSGLAVSNIFIYLIWLAWQRGPLVGFSTGSELPNGPFPFYKAPWSSMLRSVLHDIPGI